MRVLGGLLPLEPSKTGIPSSQYRSDGIGREIGGESAEGNGEKSILLNIYRGEKQSIEEIRHQV